MNALTACMNKLIACMNGLIACMNKLIACMNGLVACMKRWPGAAGKGPCWSVNREIGSDLRLSDNGQRPRKVVSKLVLGLDTRLALSRSPTREGS